MKKTNKDDRFQKHPSTPTRSGRILCFEFSHPLWDGNVLIPAAWLMERRPIFIPAGGSPNDLRIVGKEWITPEKFDALGEVDVGE